jgi:hypothetical protein
MEIRMKKNTRLLAWMLPSILLVFACTGMPQTETKTPVPPGGILFEDDFSDESGEWDEITDEYGTTAYADGEYLIKVAEPMSFLFSDPDEAGSYTDTRIDVDVLASDDAFHDMGVVCRVLDSDNFYYFIIASDGYYAIGKFKDGEDTLLGTDEMLYDEDGVINLDVADNHIRADCIGDTLTLYANGEELQQVKDSDFSKGTVGLIAGSYEDVPVIVMFDNFVVTKA